MIGLWVLFFFSSFHSRCRRQPKSTAQVQVPYDEEVEYDTDASDREEGRRRECWLVPLCSYSSKSLALVFKSEAISLH